MKKTSSPCTAMILCFPSENQPGVSWNAYLPDEEQEQAVVTYDMNILQSLPLPNLSAFPSTSETGLIRLFIMPTSLSLIPPFTREGRMLRQATVTSFETAESRFAERIGATVFMRTD